MTSLLRAPLSSTRGRPLGALALGIAALGLLAGAADGARAQDDRYVVTVAPDYGELEPGARVPLKAQLYRKGEATYSHHDWQWQTDGGGFQNGYRTAYAENIWIAPSRPGTYTVRVTTERAERGGNWASATFVVKPRYRNLRIAPLTAALRPGEAVRLGISCDGGHRPGELQWMQVEGGTIEGFDTFRAGPHPGLYNLGLRDNTTGELIYVQVRVERPRSRGLVIEPRELILAPGEWRDFEVRASAPVNWSELRWTRVEGGAIEGTRRFRAGPTSGVYTLALQDTLTGEEQVVTVRVRSPLVCEPAALALAPGQTARLAIRHDGAWRAGRFQWTRVEGGRCPTWDSFEAGAVPGRYTLELRDLDTGELLSIPVTIERQLRLIPEVVTVRPGEQVRFDIESGRRFRWNEVRWLKVDGGVLTGGRVYLAGSAPGRFEVRVKDTVTGAEASSWITIEAPAIAAVTVTPRFLRARSGERVRIAVEAFGAENQPLIGSFRWEVVGGGGRCTADGWFTPDCAPGRHVKIRVTEIRSGRWDECDVYVY